MEKENKPAWASDLLAMVKEFKRSTQESTLKTEIVEPLSAAKIEIVEPHSAARRAAAGLRPNK